MCQDVPKGFVQSLNKGEEEEEEVEEDNVDEEEVEEEEEVNDMSAETEAPSTSLDDPTEKSTETSQSAVSEQSWVKYLTFIHSFVLLTRKCHVSSFQKLEELKEASVPDGEQRGDGGLFIQGSEVRVDI